MQLGKLVKLCEVQVSDSAEGEISSSSSSSSTVKFRQGDKTRAIVFVLYVINVNFSAIL